MTFHLAAHTEQLAGCVVYAGLELTRKKHGSSLEDDIDLEVDSDSYEEGFRSPVTEKNKIGNGNDFDDVEGMLAYPRIVLALEKFIADGGSFFIGRCFEIAYIRLIDCTAFVNSLMC
uniref:Uncharacterized protein n=1 Tax=Hyaloperonospora arabidopsidis (strain Emoy2) TaxID=559515 RepID=M4BK29_HYAAE